MSYTHTLEVKAGEIDFEGEIVFNSGNIPSFKATAGEELSFTEHEELSRLMRFLEGFNRATGGIDKIELLKK